MKNLLSTIVLVACAVSVFTACRKDDNKGKLDPSAKVYISPAPGVKAAAANPEHLSAREIVLQARMISWPHNDNEEKHYRLGVDDWNRDTVNNRLMLSSTHVISYEGELALTFIGAHDMVLVLLNDELMARDTIAYIPNHTIIEADKAIRAAYAREDYASCYKLFETAFRFIPITGEEWRDLKAANK